VQSQKREKKKAPSSSSGEGKFSEKKNWPSLPKGRRGAAKEIVSPADAAGGRREGYLRVLRTQKGKREKKELRGDDYPFLARQERNEENPFSRKRRKGPKGGTPLRRREGLA